MLSLKNISKISILASLILVISAGSVFAARQKGNNSRSDKGKSRGQTVRAKQPRSPQRPAVQKRTAASQNQRSIRANQPKVRAAVRKQSIRKPQPIQRGGSVRNRIGSQRNNSVTVNRTRTMTKTVTVRPAVKKTVTRVPSVTKRTVVSPRQNNNRTSVIRRTQVTGKTLTQRRQSRAIETKPAPRKTRTEFRQNRVVGTNPVRQKTRTKIEHRRKVEKVVAVDKRINHADRRAGHRQHVRVDRKVRNRIERPRVVKSEGRGGRSHRSGGLHGGHTIHHDRIVFGCRPGRIFNRVVWPRYRYRLRYNWGPRVVWRYVRPHYHRKYVFVSIGGWWPVYYRPLRYYYYSWHPFAWYGSYPTAYQVAGTTNNYYTYDNTYTAAGVSGPLEGVDETTFEDVRQRMAEEQEQQEQQPDTETLADRLFEDAVKAFEENDYETAVRMLAEAAALEPDDLILPFAYTQALFADEQYYEASEILRLGLANLPGDKEGIFFPRGLYAEDEILFEQIEQLKEKSEIFPFDADLKLLLGYQYIGVGEYEQAEGLVTEAARYERNSEASEILLRLLEKLQETSQTNI